MNVVFTTADFLRLIAVILALPGAFFFFRALGRARSSRTAAYYATRRKAAHASNRDLSSFFIIAIIATLLAVISIFLPPEITTPEPQLQAAVLNQIATPTGSPQPTSLSAKPPTPVPIATVSPTPLVSAIRYTQQAQIVTAAQDAARTTRERLTRDARSSFARAPNRLSDRGFQGFWRDRKARRRRILSYLRRSNAARSPKAAESRREPTCSVL